MPAIVFKICAQNVCPLNVVPQSHTTGTGVTVNTDPEIVVQVTTVWSPHREAHCTRTKAHRRMHIKIEIQTEADTRTNTHMRTPPPPHTHMDTTHTHTLIVLPSGWLCMCMSTCYTWGLRRLPRPSSMRY